MAPPILPDHNNGTQPHQNRFLTPQRLAEFLGMNVTFIYERLRPDHQDRIPHLRFGRKIKIDIESPEWLRWLGDHKTC